MATATEYGGPWYRHFWPWFIVVLLSSSVIGGIATVIIAVRGADALVDDNYYKDGNAINRDLAADREADLREARANVSLDRGIAIELDILGDAPKVLQLDLSHVTRAELDRSIRLERQADGRYVAQDAIPDGRFYATLRPAGEGRSWRLRKRITLPADHHFAMEPAG